MSKINTLHHSFVSVIPDCASLTNDRASSRSRFFGFTKQHRSQKSNGVIGDALRKKEEGNENIREDKENVRPSFRRSRALTVTPFSRGAQSRSLACAVAEGESNKTMSGNLQPQFLESQAIKVKADHRACAQAARAPFASVVNTDVSRASESGNHDSRKTAKRGRSPERPQAMQYKRRYSIALRGLTPSPTRPERSRDADSMDVDSSPGARVADVQEEFMTSPVRRNFRLARRPPTPCRSVALVKPRPIVEDKPLPLTLDKEVGDHFASYENRTCVPHLKDEKPCAPLPRGRGRSHTAFSVFRLSLNSIRSNSDH